MSQDVKPQDVWNAWVPYEEDNNNGKLRPVLVLSVNNQRVATISIPITSREPRNEFDIEIFDWASIPLKHISTARISKVVTIPLSDFKKKMGRLSDDDWNTITTLYGQYVENKY